MSAALRVFRAELVFTPGQRTLTFIRLPFDARAVFGRARAPVRVTLGEHAYRSTVSAYRGTFWVPVRRSNREAAGLVPGDTVRVVLELDEKPRTVKAPRELAAALKEDAKARAAWNALSFSHKQEHARAIAGAKKPETRARRVAAALAMLKRR